MEKLDRIVGFLDRELKIAEFEDSSHNGLQVENAGSVTKVCCGVDASMAFFEEAARRGGDLLVCHHGISWGDSLKRLTHLNYRRVAFLIQHGMALYGCHLPLDAHPRLGNNAQLSRALGLGQLRRFGLYRGTQIGFEGKLPRPMRYETFRKRVARVVGRDVTSMDFGPKTVRTVAVVSGGAASEVAEAGEKRRDVYVSGEPALSAYSTAQEFGIHAIFAGHYATETFGVQAVAELLAKRFRLPAEFVDLQVPY